MPRKFPVKIAVSFMIAEKLRANEWAAVPTYNLRAPSRFGDVDYGDEVSPGHRQRSRRTALLGSILTAASPLLAQPGRVRFVVQDARGAPIRGATVSLLGADGKPAREFESEQKIVTTLQVGSIGGMALIQLSGISG
jgi:hypothetical protein